MRATNVSVTLAIPWIKRIGKNAPLAQSAYAGAFLDFFATYGYKSLVILIFISCYRISDFVMGALSKALYADRGYTAEQVGFVDGTFSLALTILGVALGGFATAKFGLKQILTLGAALAIIGNLMFVWLSFNPAEIWRLASAVFIDNFAGGFAATVFIVFLSRLTNPQHTAAQYALFSSFAFLVPQLLAGSSGVIQEAIGYAGFFTYAAILGLPAILLASFAMAIVDQEQKPAPVLSGCQREKTGVER